MSTQETNQASDIVSPILSTIFELGESGIVSVKGNVGDDCARALHEVYAKKIDPASGYVLESMQQDNETNNVIMSSVVDEKEHYNNKDKYYHLVYSIDPAKISPVDLIDFKAAANETTHDDTQSSTMTIYIPEKPEVDMDISPVMEVVNQVATDNSIKTVIGIESLVEHLKGLQK